MKTWRIEIEVQTGDAVTAAEMQEVAGKITEDAVMPVGDEIAGNSVVLLGEIERLA